jgi:hypothetical protein
MEKAVDLFPMWPDMTKVTLAPIKANSMMNG